MFKVFTDAYSNILNLLVGDMNVHVVRCPDNALLRLKENIRLHNVTRNMDLKINISKTKALVFDGKNEKMIHKW